MNFSVKIDSLPQTKMSSTWIDVGKRWSSLLNDNIPLDLVIAQIIPLLTDHSMLGALSQTCNEGNVLANDARLWMHMSQQRGWLKEFQTKVEFRNAMCGLNTREKQRRCDFTTLKKPLLSYYHPKALYKTRHDHTCSLCGTDNGNRFTSRNYYAFVANMRICRACYIATRTRSIAQAIEYNIISQKDTAKYFLVPKKTLENIPSASVTLTMGSKACLYSERVSQQQGWLRFGGEQAFLLEFRKRQVAAEKRAKQKKSEQRSKKNAKLSHGWERPSRNYQYTNALQLTHLLHTGSTDPAAPSFNMYRLDPGESGFGEDENGLVKVNGLR